MSTELRDQLQASLGGLYVLERELGGGGMSRVFVAKDTALERRIVVKVLPPEMAAAVNAERFRREIRLAASLLHPHIIPLLSAGESGGIPYYTMPFVEGESLRLRLSRDGRLPVSEAARLACEVAGALDYAHRTGVVHRDMKPGNILWHDGHALVTDFGIARAIKEAATGTALTTVGIVIGTPAYMSPEQGSGTAELDGRSDIYALGCVLYEMLAGGPPFTGTSPQAILMRHANDPVPNVRVARPEVTVALERAITKALAKDPAHRFAAAAEFAAALEDSGAVYGGATRGADVTPAASADSGSTQRFVAVLPFENMSADPDNEYFSDGITEDIIAQLSKIPGLKVMSRLSTLRYKHRPQSVLEVGRELGVSHVLEGSVRRAGTKLRIGAQLLSAQNDEQLWAETYDREMADVFAIQTDVAQRIAERLHAQLSPSDRSRLAMKPTEDLEAYKLYLLGRHHYDKVTPADFAKALDYYRRAIERDRKFARAYASLAEAQIYLGAGYWGVRPHDTYPEVFALGSTALTLDPNSAEAHFTLGMYHEWYEYRWDEAGAQFARAVELNPNAPMIRVCYAMHLCAQGRFDEAILQREQACQLDPTAMAVRGNATFVLYLAGRLGQAVADGRSLREIEPSSPYAAFSHGLVCAHAGLEREAVAAFRDAVTLSQGASLYVVMLAYALARAGEQAEARSILADVRKRETTEFIWPQGLAMAYAHLGDEDTALDYLERAYDERVGWMAFVGREPALGILHASRRFQDVLRKIGPREAIREPQRA